MSCKHRYICDRCGKELKDDEINRTYFGSRHAGGERLDLCEKCSDSFMKWFKGDDDGVR